jgi:hypothetical protein
VTLEVLIFMLSLDCSTDFDSEFWGDFDGAMSEVWGVNATTSCYETAKIPSNLYEYKTLASKLLAMRDENAVASTDFTTYIDSLLGQSLFDRQKEQQIVFLTEYSETVFLNPAARGIAYPTENMAFVKNNYEYSTATISHEILHLVLEEQGYDKECYVEQVHENQFSFAMMQMGSYNKFPLVNKFECVDDVGF